jgi:hypothetical protein
MFIIDNKDNSNDNHNIYLRKSAIEKLKHFVVTRIKAEYKFALSGARVKSLI